jgi:hypothetical protein
MTKAQAEEIEQQTISKLRWRANIEGDNEASAILLNHCLMVQRDATATEFAKSQVESLRTKLTEKLSGHSEVSYSDRLRDLGLDDAQNG